MQKACVDEMFLQSVYKLSSYSLNYMQVKLKHNLSIFSTD